MQETSRFNTYSMTRLPVRPAAKAAVLSCLLFLLPAGFSSAARYMRTEQQVLRYILSDAFNALPVRQTCQNNGGYRVYLIDNFEQTVHILPELETTHGEMMEKLLLSGRTDIDVVTLNTGLSKGLAMVIQALSTGDCIDAVISSTPGSNYTYDQVSSLLAPGIRLTHDNILLYRDRLMAVLRNIAFQGFPSVEWFERIDLNTVKLKNDALKFVFIEALAQLNIPVLLPYGNVDTRHRGKIRAVNLLSLALNAKVYSALDQNGQRIPGFPYSPLSSGDEQAVYNIFECPHPTDPFKVRVDINNDGFFDYTFIRTIVIPYYDASGHLAFAPAATLPEEFSQLLGKIKQSPGYSIQREMVLTAGQYNILKQVYPPFSDFCPDKAYVWMNSGRSSHVFSFNAACRNRGRITGTSLIPPNKVKEILPARQTGAEPSRPVPDKKENQKL